MEKDLVELFGQTARRIRRRQLERLAPLGLTPSLSRALRVITSAEEPLRMAELADRLGVVPRSVTTVVDALEKAGLAAREPDPGNRRSTLVSATDQGRAVRTRMAEARREAAEEVFRPLTAGQREQLRALLALLDDRE
ncbi:MarR family transcriptional regulator [Actinomadura fulvescens]|uniref:HTH marR-type domain-containing protein n=1 Tax=Actinomadura fulvescens TaxID=46160 RepID=A0ABN3PGI3_9ACTN